MVIKLGLAKSRYITYIYILYLRVVDAVFMGW